LWKGHRLLAGDGSTLNLPASQSIEKEFGLYSKTELGTKRYLARVFLTYDVLNDFVVDAQIANMKYGEKRLLQKSLQQGIFEDNDILLLDRLYGNFCTLKELMSQDRSFCVRLSTKNSILARETLKSTKKDIVTVWVPSKKEKVNTRNRNFDTEPIKVRIVKVFLNTGEVELLATNLLDQQKYTVQDLSELYHSRWGVEEGFKNLKPKMNIEKFGCRKPEGVLQEFYAHIFMMNCVALFGQEANRMIHSRTKKRKLQYQYNWQNAYRFMRQKIISLVLKPTARLVNSLLNDISATMTSIRDNRIFPRDMRNRNRIARITQFYK
jgi:hypothetical protein